MMQVQGRMIRLPQGDTGVISFVVEGMTLNEDDRAVFTVRRRSGGMVMQKVIAPQENVFRMPFVHEETEKISPGEYVWDLRVAVGAQMDESGRVTGGREVITPWPAGTMKVMKVVGTI